MPKRTFELSGLLALECTLVSDILMLFFQESTVLLSIFKATLNGLVRIMLIGCPG